MSDATTLESTPSAGPARVASVGLGRHVVRWAGRLFLGVVVLLVVLLLVAIGWFRGRMKASLPQLEGEATLAGLVAAVEVERDAQGVPRVRGANRLDVARATGFLHAQERFFQMDLQRRTAAGELGELFGPPGLEADRRLRRHRFGEVARQAFAQADARERALIEAYTEGVNAGLAALGEAPFEYLVLRIEPRSWRPEDAYLTLLAMYVQLQGRDIRDEAFLSLLHEVVPKPLAEFLTPEGTSWDAPLAGEPLPSPPIPGPEVANLRAMALNGEAGAPRRVAALAESFPVPQGSNCFALAGSRTASGEALLANDPHLMLGVPNLWYRVALSWPGEAGEPERSLTGVTLPGAPVVVIGSNGSVAWGFTTSQLDAVDFVYLELDPDDPSRYRVPEGFEPFEIHQEKLVSADGSSETLRVQTTRWGPVYEDDALGRPRALRWAAHDPAAVGFEIWEMEAARTVDDAVAVAHRAGIPSQNFITADREGRIAWTIIGRLPVRQGFRGRTTVSWANGERGWNGWLPADQVPRVIDPESGQLWAANNRLMDRVSFARVGTGQFALGARAGRIRERLSELEAATREDMLDIQLDTHSRLIERWRDLLVELLDARSVKGHPARAMARELAVGWDGLAAADSAGYRLLRDFRANLRRDVFGFMTAAVTARDPEASYVTGMWQSEGPLWALVTEQPLHLLDPRYESWHELLLHHLDQTVTDLTGENAALSDQTWGKANVLAMRHPLSRAIPGVGRWLDMPATPQAGDAYVPRVASPGFGVSFRMVVSPGSEERAIFHMPGGQSGHPLSPHYRTGHSAWLNAEATPLLPGPPVNRLSLRPKGSG